MAVYKQLNRALARARTEKVIPFDDRSRFILFSDCHRGDNSWRDDLAPNKNIYWHALSYYFTAGYHYIELGDGDELWEIRDFDIILKTYNSIFRLLHRYYEEGRFDLIYGNHDHVRQDPRVVEGTMSRFYDEVQKVRRDLFPGLRAHEAVVLQYKEPGQELFLVHGHQGNWLNDYLWRTGRSLVRYVWGRLQYIGWHDPTRPAENFILQEKIGASHREWLKKRWSGKTQDREHRTLMVSGHTHKPLFPSPGAPPCFNTGCCVHPQSITGIEIAEGAISLIKWHQEPADPEKGLVQEESVLKIRRTYLEGPVRLEEFFKASIE